MTKNKKLKSQRADGFGHWPKGKPRSTLSPEKRAEVRWVLLQARRKCSARAIADHLGVTPRAIDRLVKGINQPTARLYRLVKERGMPSPRPPTTGERYSLRIRDSIADWLRQLGGGLLPQGIEKAAALAGYEDPPRKSATHASKASRRSSKQPRL